MKKPKKPKWTVIDLFSGAGGMSYGFHAHPLFQLIGSVDAQLGKPSSGRGSLQCNLTYKANMGLDSVDADLSTVDPKELREAFKDGLGKDDLTVLISCAPCTGFSRANAQNHVVDDARNSLVQRTALFVEEFKPSILLMENAREMIQGNFAYHFHALRDRLTELGYEVHAQIHMLNRFGLPQLRERALVIAVNKGLSLRTLDELWEGYRVKPEATHVRRAIGSLPPVGAGEAHSDDPIHVSPSFSDPKSVRRLKLIPKDGGSWADLKDHPEAESILIPSMLNAIAKKKFGSYPDVYGRLWWDRPAVTIKRECSHTGNGRYAHPEQDRLCTVRELGILNGFPKDYQFVSSVSNMYRHIGDAVPPLISYQLAKVCEWILTGEKPSLDSIILPNTHLSPDDIEPAPEPSQIQLELPIRPALVG